MSVENEKQRIAEIEKYVKQLYECAKTNLGFDKDVKISFLINEENARNPFGKTAYYDPQNMKVAVYVTERHVKDILRSLSHELVHHAQNCRGMFDNVSITREDYIQHDEHLRQMEEEAYLKGNMIFRTWTESMKK